MTPKIERTGPLSWRVEHDLKDVKEILSAIGDLVKELRELGCKVDISLDVERKELEARQK